MINRRTFFAMSAAFGLVACGEPGQLLDASTASSIKITEVTAQTTVTRAETALPKAQIVETTRAKLAAALGKANPAGTRAVRADVVISQFLIANPVAGAVLGTRQSSINTTITLVDVATGAAVEEPLKLFGITEPRPTILGAAAIKAPAQELEIITDDLVRRALVAIYGN